MSYKDSTDTFPRVQQREDTSPQCTGPSHDNMTAPAGVAAASDTTGAGHVSSAQAVHLDCIPAV